MLAGTDGAHMLVALTMHADICADIGQKLLPGVCSMGVYECMIRILAVGEILHPVYSLLTVVLSGRIPAL